MVALKFSISKYYIIDLILFFQDLRKKPGFDSKSFFLTHKYLRETGFAEFAFVSPVSTNLYDFSSNFYYDPSMALLLITYIILGFINH